MEEIIEKRTEKSKTFKKDNGQKVKRIYNKPIHYKDEKGNFKETDVSLKLQPHTKDFNHYMTDKNKFSYGFRTDGDPKKMYGIRLNKGSQFEISPVQIQLDNTEVDLSNGFNSVNLTNPHVVEHEVTNDVDIWNKVHENYLKTAIKTTKWVSTFKITERIHIKGFTIKNELVDGKYVPNEENAFVFESNKDPENVIVIPQPKMWTETGEYSEEINHSLERKNGKLIYTKTPTKQGEFWLMSNKPTFYIDASNYTSTGTTADGYVTRKILISNTSWSNMVSAASGSTTYDTSTTYTAGMIATTGKDYYYITRSFLYFDTSSIEDYSTIDSVVLNVNCDTNANTSVIAQEGTQANTLATTDYDAFGSNWSSNVSLTADAWNSITLNSTARNNLNLTGTTKICLREYNHDHQVVEPASETGYLNGIYYSESTNAPYLDITYIADNTAPSISVDSSSRGWDNTDVSVTISASDSESGLDTLKYAWSTSTSTPSSWTSISSGTTVTQSSNGQWYLHVRATDNSGNTNTTYYGTYNIDKTNPSDPTNLDAQYEESGYGAVFSWDTSTDADSGVSHYEVGIRENDGTWNNTNNITSTSHYYSALNEGSSYDFRVRAYDNAGNTSNWVYYNDVTIPDNTDPTKPYNVSVNPLTSKDINGEDGAIEITGLEPTENLIVTYDTSALYGSATWFNVDVEVVTDNDCPVGDGQVAKLDAVNNSSYEDLGNISVPVSDFSVGDIYTLSWWFKGNNEPNYADRIYTDHSANEYVRANKTWKSRPTPDPNQWQYYEVELEIPDPSPDTYDSTSGWLIPRFFYRNTDDTSIGYFSPFQLEKKSHATTFVNGIRNKANVYANQSNDFRVEDTATSFASKNGATNLNVNDNNYATGTEIGYYWSNLQDIGRINVRFWDGDDRIYYGAKLQYSFDTTNGTDGTWIDFNTYEAVRGWTSYDLNQKGVKGVRIKFDGTGNTTNGGHHIKFMLVNGSHYMNAVTNSIKIDRPYTAIELNSDTNDEMTIPHTSTNDIGTGSFTVEITFKANFSESPDSYPGLACKGNPGWNFWSRQSDFGFRLDDNSGNDVRLFRIYKSDFPELTHVTAVVDRNNDVCTLYHNGNVAGTADISILGDISNTDDIRLGFSNGNHTTCTISKFRLWNDVRTQSEIQDNMWKELNGDENSLIANYNINAMSGSEIIDNTSNANNGTINGGVWTEFPGIYDNETWYFAFDQTDDGGNVSPKIKDSTVTPDRTTPNNPNISTSEVRQYDVTLNWTANDANSSIDYCQLYFHECDSNGDYVADVDIDGDGNTENSLNVGAVNSYNVTGLKNHTYYRYKVVVYDTEGNNISDGYYTLRTVNGNAQGVITEINTQPNQSPCNTITTSNVNSTGVNSIVAYATPDTASTTDLTAIDTTNVSLQAAVNSTTTTDGNLTTNVSINSLQPIAEITVDGGISSIGNSTITPNTELTCNSNTETATVTGIINDCYTSTVSQANTTTITANTVEATPYTTTTSQSPETIKEFISIIPTTRIEIRAPPTNVNSIEVFATTYTTTSAEILEIDTSSIILTITPLIGQTSEATNPSISSNVLKTSEFSETISEDGITETNIRTIQVGKVLLGQTSNCPKTTINTNGITGTAKIGQTSLCSKTSGDMVPLLTEVDTSTISGGINDIICSPITAETYNTTQFYVPRTVISLTPVNSGTEVGVIGEGKTTSVNINTIGGNVTTTSTDKTITSKVTVAGIGGTTYNENTVSTIPLEINVTPRYGLIDTSTIANVNSCNVNTTSLVGDITSKTTCKTSSENVIVEPISYSCASINTLADLTKIKGVTNYCTTDTLRNAQLTTMKSKYNTLESSTITGTVSQVKIVNTNMTTLNGKVTIVTNGETTSIVGNSKIDKVYNKSTSNAYINNSSFNPEIANPTTITTSLGEATEIVGNGIVEGIELITNGEMVDISFTDTSTNNKTTTNVDLTPIDINLTPNTINPDTSTNSSGNIIKLDVNPIQINPLTITVSELNTVPISVGTEEVEVDSKTVSESNKAEIKISGKVNKTSLTCVGLKTNVKTSDTSVVTYNTVTVNSKSVIGHVHTKEPKVNSETLSEGSITNIEPTSLNNFDPNIENIEVTNLLLKSAKTKMVLDKNKLDANLDNFETDMSLDSVKTEITLDEINTKVVIE